MTDHERRLLRRLMDCSTRRVFAAACDGKDRAPAHALERLGYVLWRGELWGSQFYSITCAGKLALVEEV